MRSIIIFVATLLIGLVATAPTSKEDDKVVVTAEFFPESLSVYTGKHDIVEIVVPLNALNFDDDDDDDESINDEGSVLFFVEGDKTENGEVVSKGLYVLKNNVATKLLENGRDAAAANDETKIVYLAATDGLYIYNATTNKAEKYGPITDSIISIAKENATETLYILTAAYEVFKVTDNGNKKDKMNIENARKIVLDYENHLYFLTANKEVYVFTDDSAKKIEGLPEALTYAQLLRPPFVIDNGVPFIADDKSYIVYANGTSEITDIELQSKPTAYSMEATLIQYYAHEKKIYEYNILAIMFGELLNHLKTFLEDKSDSIQSIATRSRSDLGKA